MLSRSAKSVQEALTRHGVHARVVELPASTRTAIDAASAIGCTVAEIVKSLIFRTKESGKAVLVLASGVNRVSEKAIQKALGEEIVKADADFVREVTGFAIGGVPPIGHKEQIQTFIDEDLLQFKEVWAAAGTPNAVFNLPSDRLVELTKGRAISIKD